MLFMCFDFICSLAVLTPPPPSTALRLSDGAVIVIDAAEGIMMQTERAMKHAVQAGVPICLVINKVTRRALVVCVCKGS